MIVARGTWHILGKVCAALSIRAETERFKHIPRGKSQTQNIFTRNKVGFTDENISDFDKS